MGLLELKTLGGVRLKSGGNYPGEAVEGIAWSAGLANLPTLTLPAGWGSGFAVWLPHYAVQRVPANGLGGLEQANPV